MIRKIEIPGRIAKDLVRNMSYSHFSFHDEVAVWFNENGFRYNCLVEYFLETVVICYLEAPEEVLVAFKLRWM